MFGRFAVPAIQVGSQLDLMTNRTFSQNLIALTHMANPTAIWEESARHYYQILGRHCCRSPHIADAGLWIITNRQFRRRPAGRRADGHAGLRGMTVSHAKISLREND